jgi:hypothetical protein
MKGSYFVVERMGVGMEVRLSGLGFEQGLVSSMKHPKSDLTALAVTWATTNGGFLCLAIPLSNRRKTP